MSPRVARGTGTRIGIVLTLGVVVASLAVEPFDTAPFTICPFKNLTGISCPLCGMTRAFLYLGHARPLEAWRLNPLSFPAAALLLLELARLLVLFSTCRDYRIARRSS